MIDYNAETHDMHLPIVEHVFITADGFPLAYQTHQIDCIQTSTNSFAIKTADGRVFIAETKTFWAFKHYPRCKR